MRVVDVTTRGIWFRGKTTRGRGMVLRGKTTKGVNEMTSGETSWGAKHLVTSSKQSIASRTTVVRG